MEGLRALLAELGLAGGEIGELVHGTTVATNAILEYRGAKTGLLTTRGFRDVLELRRVRAPELYNARYRPPRPMVERRLRLEVEERLDAQVREIRLLEGDAVLQIRSDTREHPPFGLHGGQPGTPSTNTLNADDSDPRELPTMGMAEIRAGDWLRHVMAGGGWGDPPERDPAVVLADVRDEKLTRGYAREVYGVVMQESAEGGPTVDLAGTQRKRAARR